MRVQKKFFSEKENEQLINWKSVELLKRYVSRFGNIKPRIYTGNSVRHQKALRNAIIRARELGLINYIK
ncbi:MAG: 30S ribosomal protein S18 [Candidatus Absconditabacteria bacterium]